MSHQVSEIDSDDQPTPTPSGLKVPDHRRAKPEKIVRVLLIEDNPGDAELIRQYFATAPKGMRFDLACARRLAHAQAALRNCPFDVVLADLNLPDSTGLATFQRIHEQMPLMPVVVLTGELDEQLALRALRHGAEDYLVKTDVRSSSLIRSVRYAVERGRRRQAERALRDTSSKMQAARDIQQKLFPAKAPQLALVTLRGRTVQYDISGASFPADAMGGDYFDYIPMMHGTLGLAVGDVSGHGYGPALLMVETRAYLRSFARTLDDVAVILDMTNRVLVDDITDGFFVTLFLGQLDFLTGAFTYASAGHTAGFWLNAAGAVKQRLDSTSLPLGVVADNAAPACGPLQLEAGDILVLLTDGVLDAEAPVGSAFGVERTLAIVRHYLTDSARDIVSNLYHGVCAFVQGEQQVDDITALVLKVKPHETDGGPYTA